MSVYLGRSEFLVKAYKSRLRSEAWMDVFVKVKGILWQQLGYRKQPRPTALAEHVWSLVLVVIRSMILSVQYVSGVYLGEAGSQRENLVESHNTAYSREFFQHSKCPPRLSRRCPISSQWFCRPEALVPREGWWRAFAFDRPAGGNRCPPDLGEDGCHGKRDCAQ